MNDPKIRQNADFLGMLSSSLCLVHCIAVPLVMGWYSVMEHSGHDHATVGHAHSHLSMGGFNWDLFFVALGAIAVYFSTRAHHITPTLKAVLWGFFAVFAVGIFLEQRIPAFQYVGYVGSLGLIVGHWINYRRCRVQGCSIA